MSNTTPRIQQLRKALEISEKIEALEQELREVMGGISGEGAPAVALPAPARRGRPPKGQQAQDSHGATAAPMKPGKKTRKKRFVSPEAREKMAAAQRRRWAKAKR